MKAPVQIVDWATREPVEAELFDEVTIEHFLETQNKWRPVVAEAARKMVQSGSPPKSLPDTSTGIGPVKRRILESWHSLSSESVREAIFKV